MSIVTATLLSWFISLTGASVDSLCGPDGSLTSERCPAGAPPPDAATDTKPDTGPSGSATPQGGRPHRGNRIYNGI